MCDASLIPIAEGMPGMLMDDGVSFVGVEVASLHARMPRSGREQPRFPWLRSPHGLETGFRCSAPPLGIFGNRRTVLIVQMMHLSSAGFSRLWASRRP
jgi:hypothetical protein